MMDILLEVLKWIGIVFLVIMCGIAFINPKPWV